MELRRALLLFVIVLGIAGVVTVLSRPAGRDDEAATPPAELAPARPESTPRAEPGPADPGERVVRFDAARAAVVRTVSVREPVTVTVSVEEAGEVALDGLGLTGSAEPDAAARFDVLPTEPGRFAVDLRTAGQRDARRVGTLRVTPAD